MHQSGHLREWILDLMSRAAAIDGFPPAADALHATALDLDHRHAQIRVGDDDIRLAILGLCSRPLLEPGDVAVDHVRRLQSLPKRRRQSLLPRRFHAGGFGLGSQWSRMTGILLRPGALPSSHRSCERRTCLVMHGVGVSANEWLSTHRMGASVKQTASCLAVLPDGCIFGQ